MGTTTFSGATAILARLEMRGGKRDEWEQRRGRTSHDIVRANQPPIPDIGTVGRTSDSRSSMDYVDVPPVAGRLSPKYARPTHIQTPASPAHSSLAPAEPTPTAPPKTMLSNLPAMLLASTAVFPVAGSLPGQRGPGTLLTTRDPLSIPITTVNFRRFVSKVGPIFWLQDRIEEILMWKRGWKVTTVWMAAYAFFCKSLFSRHVRFPTRAELCQGFFPRLILLIPNALLVTILLRTYPAQAPDDSQYAKNTVPPAPPPQAFEGTAVWQANLQAIQNLMGFVCVSPIPSE